MVAISERLGNMFSAVMFAGSKGTSVQLKEGGGEPWMLVKTDIFSGKAVLSRGEEKKVVPASKLRSLDESNS